MLSIVIPVHNEEPSLLPLYDRLTAVLESIQKPYEILFVDDASNDRSFELLANLVANWLMAKASGVELRDFGTTFKAYRAEILKDVHLYGELHRFIPALASFYGARVAEVPIRNTPRAAGDSHYGLGRTFRVLFDIVTIKFLLKYFTRPMHFFGALGLVGTGLGGLILSYLAVYKLLGHEIVMEHGPLMVAGALLLLAGLMMFSTGLLGEVLIRTYFETQDRRIYAVRQILAKKERRAASR